MDFGIITKHPIASGGIILAGGLILYLYWRGGSSSSQPVVTYSAGVDPQTAAINAQTQLQEDSLTAQTQTALAQISSNEAMTKLQTDAATLMNQQSNAASVQIAGINASAAAAQSANDAATQMASIEAALHATLDTNATNLAGLKDTNASTLAGLKDTNATNIEINHQNTDASVTIAGIGATRDITINQQNNDTMQLGIKTQGDVYSGYFDTVNHLSDNDLKAKQDMYNYVDKTLQIGQSKGAGGSSSGVAQIVASALGQGPQAIAANQPASVASSPGAILQGIGGIVGAVSKFFNP